MSARSAWGVGVVWIVIVAACRPADEVPGHAVRDSAEVEIVESHRPQWAAPDVWRLAPEAIVRIGVVEGSPEYELSEVVGAVRAADGTILVADGGSQEVRFFDASGRLERRVGGRGAGPGEFTGLSGLGRAPDGSVWAYDFTLRRLTWLSGSGEVLSVITLDPEPPVLSPVGAVEGGTFVMKQLWGARGAAAANAPGLRRDPVAYVRYDATGALVDTVGLFPGREIRLSEEDGRVVMGAPPFGRISVGAIRDGHVVVGSQIALELVEVTPGGMPVRIVRITQPDPRLTQADIRAYVRSRTDEAPPERRSEVERSLTVEEFPELRPAHGDLVVDAGGRIWVAAWTASPDAPTGWNVIDTDGAWLGEVRMPERFRPYDIGDSWVLGLERDELGVERVVLYELLKAP